MRVAIVIQARLGSERLPQKVLRDFNGMSLLQHVHRRALGCHAADAVIVSWGCACGGKGCDDCMTLTDHMSEHMIRQWGGPENDLITRHLGATLYAGCNAFVRVTADCLFHDPRLIDDAITRFKLAWPAYRCASNWWPGRSWSEGVDLDIWTLDMLADLNADPNCHRETFASYGVTLRKAKHMAIKSDYQDGDWHTSIDTPEDAAHADKVLKRLGNDEWSYHKLKEAWKV